ncbi:hypothetical protein [uncultured Jannaschia sp.]|uniref:hypothetical protein n=1 Tax=uncultured Jannaschia sp. TaxID=293347 RepID=UPI002612CBAB|nr:hypothetical protein [uncultured Jannaschia sp.]
MRPFRIHGVPARESLDKVVLFAAFVLGTLGTIWLKLVEVPVQAVALFPVVVLLAYVVACLLLRNIGTEPETIGDNSYYLGFLFTLASLAVTLYRIKDIGAEDADLIPTVISGFGVALTSTIAGVFLRVFLLQLRPDIVVRDRTARNDLNEGARDLRKALAEASLVLKSVAVETQQHVAERNARMSKVLEVQVEQTSELLERQAKAFDGIIEEAGKRLTQEISDVVRREAEASVEELSMASQAFRENVDAAARARLDAEKSLQESMEEFRDVVHEIQQVARENNKATEGSYRTLAARTKKMSQSLADASDTAEKAVALSSRILEDAERVAAAKRTTRSDTSPLRANGPWDEEKPVRPVLSLPGRPANPTVDAGSGGNGKE